MLQRRTGSTSGTTHDGPGVGGVGVGKQTLVQQLEAAAPPAPPQPVVQRKADKTDAAPGDMWQQTFGEDSAAVGKLGRVQAAKGVNLLARPTPGATSTGAPVPFNGLVRVERNTTQAKANQRWCYVIATDSGAAGFCEERYLAIDPPEPTATLRRTAGGERLATIAAEAYGAPTDDSNSRMQVQALYIANRDRAGVTLDQIVPNAGKHVEAVIDWNNTIIYFSKEGIKNPTAPGGWLEPLLGYRAAFMDEARKIVGYNDVDLVDGPTGVTVKVTK